MYDFILGVAEQHFKLSLGKVAYSYFYTEPN